MNCLLDQGLPRTLAAQLRQVGWDAVHVGEIHWSQAEDFQILERAAAEDRVMLTLDSDFHQSLALSGNSQPSVVRFRDEGLTVDQYVRLLFKNRVSHSTKERFWLGGFSLSGANQAP